MEYLSLFFLILCLFVIGYYIVPVAISYYVFFILKKKDWEHKRIENKYPDREGIKREIKWSLLTMLIFSAMTFIMVLLIRAGYTKMYFEISEFGWIYFVISPVIAIVLHDTYYYWLHRAMHSKPLYKYFHKLHHRSVHPSPWAIYAFQPAEAIFTYFSFVLLLFLVPMHPAGLGIYLLVSLINNIGGHTGYEIVPSWVVKSKIFRYTNVVTFHDMHHTKFNCNFGAYFNIWDRLMGTLHKDFENKYFRVKSGELNR